MDYYEELRKTVEEIMNGRVKEEGEMDSLKQEVAMVGVDDVAVLEDLLRQGHRKFRFSVNSPLRNIWALDFSKYGTVLFSGTATNGYESKLNVLHGNLALYLNHGEKCESFDIRIYTEVVDHFYRNYKGFTTITKQQFDDCIIVGDENLVIKDEPVGKVVEEDTPVDKKSYTPMDAMQNVFTQVEELSDWKEEAEETIMEIGEAQENTAYKANSNEYFIRHLTKDLANLQDEVSALEEQEGLATEEYLSHLNNRFLTRTGELESMMFKAYMLIWLLACGLLASFGLHIWL